MTESDPNGLDPSEPGAKLDTGKPDASLLGMFGLALLAVAEVGTFGTRTKGYARGGWQHVENGIDRYTAAMIRHWAKEHREFVDEESVLLHAAHVAWNALARLEHILRTTCYVCESKKTTDIDYTCGKCGATFCESCGNPVLDLCDECDNS